VAEKLREAQKAFGAGDCGQAQVVLHEVIASDPQNFVAHLLSAHCFLRQKDYSSAAAEFRRTLEIRPDAQQGVLGLIQAYALGGDKARRDGEVEHLRQLMKAGKIPSTARFVREQFTAGESTVIANEYPVLSLSRVRYAFDVLDPQQKPVRQFALVSRESEQPSRRPGVRRFTLEASAGMNGAPETLRVYDRGEPSYEQVVADVNAALAKRPMSAGSYTVAKTPAAVEPFVITRDEERAPQTKLTRGEVAIEYIAHSAFRIRTATGTRILLDPYASRMWLGYDFPQHLSADEILITHPHYDHDADVLLGGKPQPWSPDVPALRDPGTYKVGDVTITGIAGKHGGPWGKEFGQTNTIWVIDTGTLRIVDLGDNGPLTAANVHDLGRVDILMMPIDADEHILKAADVHAIRTALHPRVVIPMHYRLPDLEPSAGSPEGLGEITPWLATQQNVVNLKTNMAKFSAASLPRAEVVIVFAHSPLVRAAAN
jgi:L-ascorbate metabolism protein UlaG (beta-lactamase superfamily)